MFHACLVKPQRLRGALRERKGREITEGKTICGETGACTHLSSLQRAEGKRIKAGGRKQDLRTAIRNVNSNSYKEIAGEVSINLNKDLDFCKFGFDCREKLALLQ